MLLGEYPFSNQDREQLKKLILKKEINLCNSAKAKALNVSQEVLDLTDRMLDKDPNKRISLIDILHHPWLMERFSSCSSDSEDNSVKMLEVDEQ